MRFANSLLACAGSAAAVLTAGLFLGVAAPAPSASAAGPAPAPVQAGKTGTIKGRLVYTGKAPALPKISGATQEFCKDQDLVDRALDVDPKTGGVAHAFVYLEKPKGKNAEAEKALAAKKTVQIDNKNCEFIPRSTALFKAQSVEFTSSDPVGHNSHYTGFTQGKNVALAAKGKVTEKLQPEKRPILLKCDIHPWMTGHIMVFDHPFFAVTKEDGSFEIDGVPAGPQNLVIWQEKAGYVNQGAAKGMPVTVKAGGSTDLGDIKLDESKIKK